MNNRLAEKTALITGASRGIGLAIAKAFAKEGASLILNARNQEKLENVAEEIKAEYKVEVIALSGDVTCAESVKNLAGKALEWKSIDIIVNNAGIHIPAPFLSYTFDEFKSVIESNVYSVFHVTQALLPGMIAGGGGRIINLASTAGKWGSRNQSAYNASKHAVVGITRCLALEMAPHNVLVNAICPWIVNTDMAAGFMEGHANALGMSTDALVEKMNSSVPLGRWVEPHEVAGLAVYLASDESSYINGQAWTVDGGYTTI
jgi:NAD(P)-dependent dehydrogenase (short-subunit alcohol dehydrogenase family)